MGEHVGTTTIFHFKEPVALGVSTPEELFKKLKNNLGSNLVSSGAELHSPSVEYKFKAQWHDAVYNINIICNPDRLDETNSVDIKYSTENNEEGQELDEERKLSDAQNLLNLIGGRS